MKELTGQRGPRHLDGWLPGQGKHVTAEGAQITGGTTEKNPKFRKDGGDRQAEQSTAEKNVMKTMTFELDL